MFTEYLINVAMAAAPYWTSATIVYLVGLLYVRKSVMEVYWPSVKVGAGVIFAIGLVMGMSSSANTYKNTVDYNPVQAQRQIEQAREHQVQTEIVDRTLKPLSAEERAANSIDMRERVNLDNR